MGNNIVAISNKTKEILETTVNKSLNTSAQSYQAFFGYELNIDKSSIIFCPEIKVGGKTTGASGKIIRNISSHDLARYSFYLANCRFH